MSGGGIMLLSSNSATTGTGRIDLELFRGTIRTGATINLEGFSSRNTGSTSLMRWLTYPDLR